MKKLILVFLVLLAAGGWGFFEYKKRATTAVDPALAQRPTNAVARLRDIQFTVTAAGDITPAEQVSVRPEVNGKIAEMPVDIGDKVTKGQLLFRLDDQELLIERSTKVTEIERSKLELDRTSRNLQRSRKLFDEKVVSKELFEESQTEYELAKNNLDRAEKALNLVEDRLSKTKIMAPFDSTILTRAVPAGQAVSGITGNNAGTEVMTIANLNDLVINAHVNISDITRLKVGQEVDVTVDSVAGLKMKGVVERISPQASFKNSIKGYAARIALKNVDQRVRPGMTANVAIPITSVSQVLTVPIAAIFSEMGQKFVFVQSSEALEKRPVKTGVSDYDVVEITDGLKEGETVSLEQVLNKDKSTPKLTTTPARETRKSNVASTSSSR